MQRGIKPHFHLFANTPVHYRSHFPPTLQFHLFYYGYKLLFFLQIFPKTNFHYPPERTDFAALQCHNSSDLYCWPFFRSSFFLTLAFHHVVRQIKLTFCQL